MISAEYIKAWRPEHPWSSPAMVEQDLVVCRAFVSIFSDPFLAEALLDTMGNRHTPCDDTLFSRLASLETHEGMHRKWENFMHTLHQDALPFDEVMHGISRFLSLAVHAAAAGVEFAWKWLPDKGWSDPQDN